MQPTQIVPGLWQSEAITPSGSWLYQGMTAVVTLDESWQPGPTASMLLVRWSIADGPVTSQPGGERWPGTVRALGEFIAGLRAAGHGVLVHCSAGLNRSGLVVARTLMAEGMNADDAIGLIRDKRLGALSNPEFVTWLLDEEMR